ncbi:MAG: DUF485 domain-containing protein [Atribacter sp.]|jgi:uncharacterized membrane protein (DUF485 family)|uniref:Inner membrane protein YjcH n=1 Tax=Candidatus Atribacter allofermentans TaxID=1852833 RepID=A0A1V5SPQ8_9BACT|nr:MAG: Inner membrane protein YjcH [Candidatus Atribacteria bacterium ADurb.Bin276]
MKKKTNKNKKLDNFAFQELYNRRKAITFTLTLFIVSIYVAYILIDAFNRELLARKISGGITLGIYIGIGIIIIGWITTGIYVWWANNKYDSLLDRIKRTTGGHS